MSIVRVVLASILGGIVAFIFGMMSWMVLPFHMMTTDSIPDQPALLQAMNEHLPTSGVYLFPYVDMEQEGAWEEMEKLHQAGPIGMIFFHKEGETPMPPSMMLWGLVVDVAAGFFIALLMAAWCVSGTPNYLQRVLFSTAIGAAGAIQSWGALWNWMYVEWDHSLVMGLDIILMWFFGGLVIAAIIKPKAQQEVYEEQS